MALAAAGIFQTIPSLALFGFLVPIPFIGGIGKADGAHRAGALRAASDRAQHGGRNPSVDAAVRESAIAMGMTDRQVLFQVEVPLAAPHNSGRDSNRDGHHDRNGDHRRGDRRRRARSPDFPRHLPRGLDADSRGRDSGGGTRTHRGRNTGMVRTHTIA